MSPEKALFDKPLRRFLSLVCTVTTSLSSVRRFRDMAGFTAWLHVTLISHSSFASTRIVNMDSVYRHLQGRPSDALMSLVTSPSRWMRSIVCLSVCLSPRVTRKSRGRTSPNFFMLPVAVARSSSDGVAIRYVLPVSR